MSNKKITRKEFISKTGKCAGGLACSPILLSIFQSCGVTGPNEDCDSLYSVTCSAHNSVFNEEGMVIDGPAPLPLLRYNVSLSNDKSKIIFNEESSDGVEISSACPCHGAQFNEEGDVLQHPNDGSIILPLTRYNASLSNDLISIEGSDELILLSDHPDLENIGGVSSLDQDEVPFDDEGLLMYRKSEEEVVVYSRICPHQGCGIDSFITEDYLCTVKVRKKLLSIAESVLMLESKLILLKNVHDTKSALIKERH